MESQWKAQREGASNQFGYEKTQPNMIQTNYKRSEVKMACM